MSHGRSTDDRFTPRAVGALFVLASVSAVLGGSLISPIAEDGADLVALRDQVSTGVVVEIVLALSVIAIAVLLFPVLRRQHEGAALGYAALRTVEGAFVLMASTSALLAVNLREDGSLGSVLSARDWTYFIGTMLVFGVSALVLNALLYWSRLVARWLAGWGLLGGLLLLVRAVLELYGLESSLAVQFVWAAPIALQEMVLAIWFLWRGFDTSHLVDAARPLGQGVRPDAGVRSTTSP
jgi:hypothetical protein